MMRRLFIFLFTIAALTASAQTDAAQAFRFGYLSYEAALQSMQEYALVQQKMKTLQEQYQAETLRVEDEFNRKYEDFLDGQRDFPRTILQKRQSELQEMYQKIQQSYQDNQQALQKASQEKMQAITAKVLDAIKAVGQAGEFVMINEINAGIPYISTTLSTDVTAQVKTKLGLK